MARDWVDQPAPSRLPSHATDALFDRLRLVEPNHPLSRLAVLLAQENHLEVTLSLDHVAFGWVTGTMLEQVADLACMDRAGRISGRHKNRTYCDCVDKAQSQLDKYRDLIAEARLLG